MFKGQFLKDIIDKKQLNYVDVFTAIGMKEGTFNSIVKEGSNPTAKNIEALADYLQCPIDSFFDRNISIDMSVNISGKEHKIHQVGNYNVSNDSCQREIEHLKEIIKSKDILLEAKDKVIEEKERMIMILLNK
ncbi:MAG: helix-turn-helix domain-containing protein [Marinifilaceae bacterium]